MVAPMAYVLIAAVVVIHPLDRDGQRLSCYKLYINGFRFVMDLVVNFDGKVQPIVRIS